MYPNERTENLMRRIARPVALAIALALAAGLTAARAAAADLEQVYRDALAYDAALASARASREAGLEKLPQGRALLLPSLSVTGNTTWNDLTLKHLNPDVSRGYNSNGWQAQLTQPLFRWQNWVQYKQGELQSTLSEAQYQLARQDLTLRAAQAYFDVLTAQDTLAAARALYEANTQQLALARKSFEVGTVTITDVHEAQSRGDLSSAQVIAAESDLAVKRHALLVLTGKEADTLKGLRKGVALSRPEPADIQAWVSAAEGSNLSVQAAQIAGEIAGREVERNRAGHLPTVDVVASYGNSATANALANFINTDIRSAVVALQVNVLLLPEPSTKLMPCGSVIRNVMGAVSVAPDTLVAESDTPPTPAPPKVPVPSGSRTTRFMPTMSTAFAAPVDTTSAANISQLGRIARGGMTDSRSMCTC